MPKLASHNSEAANALVPGSKEWLAAQNKAKTSAGENSSSSAASSSINADSNIDVHGKTGLLTKSVTTISVKVDCDPPKFFFIERMDEQTKLTMDPTPDEELTSRLMISTRQSRPVQVLLPRHSVIATISYSQARVQPQALKKNQPSLPEALFAVAATSMVVGDMGSCLVVEGITCLPLGFRWIYLAACAAEGASDTDTEPELPPMGDYYYGMDMSHVPGLVQTHGVGYGAGGGGGRGGRGKKKNRGSGVLTPAEVDAASEIGKIIFDWSTGVRVYSPETGTGYSLTAGSEGDDDDDDNEEDDMYGNRTVYSTANRSANTSRLFNARGNNSNSTSKGNGKGSKGSDGTQQSSIVQPDLQLIAMVDKLFKEWI